MKIIWVATTGNDSTGNGTRSSPYSSIERALQDFVSGDQIRILDGTYIPTDSIIISGMDGSLFAENPGTVYIQPEKTTLHQACVAILETERFSLYGINVLQASESTGNLIGFYVEKKGLEADKKCHPLNIGGSYRKPDYTLTMVRADHTSDIVGEEYMRDGSITPGSGSVGYILELVSGTCIYFSGDTGVFGDMSIIRELYQPNVDILTVGGRYNMGVKEAAYATALLDPKLLIAIHHGTFPDQYLDFEDLKHAMDVRSPKVELIEMAVGEEFDLN